MVEKTLYEIRRVRKKCQICGRTYGKEVKEFYYGGVSGLQEALRYWTWNEITNNWKAGYDGLCPKCLKKYVGGK